MNNGSICSYFSLHPLMLSVIARAIYVKDYAALTVFTALNDFITGFIEQKLSALRNEMKYIARIILVAKLEYRRYKIYLYSTRLYAYCFHFKEGSWHYGWYLIYIVQRCCPKWIESEFKSVECRANNMTCDVHLSNIRKAAEGRTISVLLLHYTRK